MVDNKSKTALIRYIQNKRWTDTRQILEKCIINEKDNMSV